MNDKLDSQLFPHSNGASGAPGRLAKTFVRDLDDGQSVESVFLLRERRLASKRNGEHYLRLDLVDASGTLPAVCWEDADQIYDSTEAGQAVLVGGDYAVDARYGPQLTVRSIRPAQESEYSVGDLSDGPATDVAQMEGDIRQLIETIRNPYLSMLCEAVFGDESAIWQAFRRAPAAKYYHEAYVHGLLEHTLSVSQGVSAISASFPGLDRDLAVTGALIHDIGKIEAYSSDPFAIDLTDDGRLLGEIPLGYFRIRRAIEQIDGFPWSLARAVLHIVLSHHGKLENGSPVVPMTREAVVVHMVDNLAGRLGSFDRLEKGLQEGEAWSQFDRALAGFAYFPGRQAAIEEQARSLPAASGE